MNLNKVKIGEDEFDFFVDLTAKQKIEFLYDSQTMGADAALLKQLAISDTEETNEISGLQIIVQEMYVGQYLLCMTRVGNYVSLNCDNLKVIRSVVRKLWLDGYVLVKADGRKSEWDMHRYFKSYHLLHVLSPISLN